MQAADLAAEPFEVSMELPDDSQQLRTTAVSL